MCPTLHALLLITLPAAAVLIVLGGKKRTPTARQFVIALGLAALGTSAAPLFNHHMCLEGEPRNQWIILGPVLLLTLVFVRSAAWRRALAGGVFVGMMGLSCHFTEVVHTPGWTGNPDWDGWPAAGLSSLQGSLQLAGLETERQDVEMSAGWVRDSLVWSALRDSDQRMPRGRRQVRPVWHSPLTGLYEYTTIPQDYWCPGGPALEAIERIELRDRVLPP